MPTFAEQIGIQKSFDYELNTTQKEFESALKNKIGPKDLGYLLDILDIFSFGGKSYKGRVTYKEFKIRKIRGFFSTNNNLVSATGTFIEKDKLHVHMVISGVNYSLFTFASTMIALSYLFFIDAFTTLPNPIFFFIITVIFMFHYISIRRGINRLKQDMEEDFNLRSED